MCSGVGLSSNVEWVATNEGASFSGMVASKEVTFSDVGYALLKSDLLGTNIIFNVFVERTLRLTNVTTLLHRCEGKFCNWRNAARNLKMCFHQDSWKSWKILMDGFAGLQTISQMQLYTTRLVQGPIGFC